MIKIRDLAIEQEMLQHRVPKRGQLIGGSHGAGICFLSVTETTKRLDDEKNIPLGKKTKYR
jgi:hypothetical protein